MRSTAIAIGLIAATFCALPAFADVPVCALAEGTAIPEIEALNALVLAAKFDEVTQALSVRMGGLAPDLLAGVAAAYPQPFTSCTTLVQRTEIGGLVQEIVVFEGAQPLFVYWVSGPLSGEIGPLSFNMNSTFGEVLQSLQ